MDMLRLYYTIRHFMTSFDHHIGKKTEAISDQVWVAVPRYDHTLVVNRIIASIQSGTGKCIILEK